MPKTDRVFRTIMERAYRIRTNAEAGVSSPEKKTP
jgi:hypothetical protein